MKNILLVGSLLLFVGIIEILPEFHAVNKRIIDLNFPKSAFIVMIKRKGEYIRPGGSTQIEAEDVLMVLADSEEDFAKVNECLYKPSSAVIA